MKRSLRTGLLLVSMAAVFGLSYAWFHSLHPAGYAIALIGALFFWVGREREKSRGSALQDRLLQYEKESSLLSKRSVALGADLNLAEKKKLHRANLIQQRTENLRNLLNILHLSFRPHGVFLYFFDSIQERFELKESVLENDRTALPEVRAEGVLLAALREKDPIYLRSAHGVRGVCYYEDAADLNIQSLIAVPLYSGKFFRGVLIIDDTKARDFDDHARKLIEEVSTKILGSLGESELMQSYFDLKEELSAFYEASSSLNRCFRVQDVMETLLESSKRIVRYDHAAVVLYDPVKDVNRVALEMGREKMGWEGETFACAQDRGLISWVIKNKMALSYPDFRARNSETPLFHKKWKIQNIFESVLLLPLVVSQDTLGAVVFLAQSKSTFSKSIRKLLEVISLQASVSMKNASMVHDLERLATTDGLTGLANHRTFQERLAQEVSRAQRHPTPFSLLLIDIDFFKKFNDEHGHPVGDFVLRRVAEVLDQTVRKVDLVARYGGEEFAILLVNTDPQNAFKMAQRIVQTVREHTFDHQGLSLNVTVSVGVASYPKDADSREVLVERADIALYDSKKKGRNRATLYVPHLQTKAAEQRPIKLEPRVH